MKQKVEPVKLDQEDFKQCLQGKLDTAKGSCNGQDCTPECYAALKKAVGSMDGSCCSALELDDKAAEQQCVGLVKTAVVPKVEEAIDAQCGGSFIDLISATIP